MGKPFRNILINLVKIKENKSGTIILETENYEDERGFFTEIYHKDKYSKVLSDINILRIKGRIWIPNKSLPLQIQIVGKKINTWYEEAPLNCWRPIDSGGLELVIISYDNESIIKFRKKIKEKFKVLSIQK